MLFVDSDCALGSPRGNVDDAYALAALIRSGVEIAAISSVAGNVPEPQAFANIERVCRLLDWKGPLLRAQNARSVLHVFPFRVLALGPLTNVCAATSAEEIILVGGSLHTFGRWPPFWPHERNLTFDRAATHHLFGSNVPLTIFPLDVAGVLSARNVGFVDGPLGEELRRVPSRAKRLYDLAAALYAIGEEGFVFEETTVSIAKNTFLRFGRGARKVKVCTKVDNAVS